MLDPTIVTEETKMDTDQVENNKRNKKNNTFIINQQREKEIANIEYIDLAGEETLASENDPECKHWRRTKGQCFYGNKCRFRHVTISVPKQHNVPKPLIFDPTTGKRKRNRPRNKGRAGIFRKWLISTFGMELLSKGTGILDVAGGRGEISFELMNLNGCTSTIIDPRNYIDYSRFKRKLLRGFYHKSEPLLQTTIDQKINGIPTEEDIKIPLQVKIFWGPSVWECLSLGIQDSLCSLHDYDDSYNTFRRKFDDKESFNNEKNLSEQFEFAQKFMWTCKGLQLDNSNENELDVQTCSFSKDETDTTSSKESQPFVCEAWEFNELKNLLENCSCVVGMHPDQAAEGIVDFALKMNKPFALIPCCVYSKQFPKRKVNGDPVTNHNDLINHLKSKHRGIKTEILPIEGKNIILYWNPNETESE